MPNKKKIEVKKIKISSKRNYLRLWIVIVFILLVIVLLLMYFTKNSKNDANAEQLAKCLTEKGAAMYGASWCSHCANQKKLFGAAFQFVTYVECTTQEELCTQKGIAGYPTWIINGQQYSGEKTFEELKQLSGC